jgi:hypothetical protein
MRTGRSRALIALAAAALVTGSAKAGAQERPAPAPPDLRMLLNLDLFRQHAGDADGGGSGEPSDGSMVDQIRALKAMGYLGGNRNNAQAAGGETDAAGARVAAPNPSSVETRDSGDSGNAGDYGGQP